MRPQQRCRRIVTSRASRSERAVACSFVITSLDAEHEFNVTGGFGGGGLGGAIFDVTLDGAKLAVQNPRNFRIKVPAGPHVVGVALVDRVRSAGVDEAYSDFRIDSAFTPPGSVQSIVITGPLTPPAWATRRVAAGYSCCRPEGGLHPPRSDEASCARKIVTTLARHAYRRPVLDDEVETLMGFYQQGTQGRRLRIGHSAGAGTDPGGSGVPLSS